MMKLYKKGLLYFGKHPLHNAIVHVLFGAGLGMLLVFPLGEGHTVRLGVALVLMGIIGHLWSVK